MFLRFEAPTTPLVSIVAAAVGLSFTACASSTLASAPSAPHSLARAAGQATVQRREFALHVLHVLYAFQGSPDGASPGALILDPDGNIFGTTASGGASNDGTVFELQPVQDGTQYTETVLHNFTGTDGISPAGAIQDNSGNLFVTTTYGGASNANDGTVVELSPSGNGYQETHLFSFDGSDGANPVAPPVESSNRLYATAEYGGRYGVGAIVGLTTSNFKESDLYDFTGRSDGLTPIAGLVADSSGALYGTTTSGGSARCGTVFKFVPSAHGGKYTVVWRFQPQNTGVRPESGVVFDASGNIYGTTVYTAANPHGWGVVYKLTPTGHTYRETILHTFAGSPTDGGWPVASLTLNGSMLYGTTTVGGLTKKFGDGTIFQVSTSGTDYAVLHSFTLESDGLFPTSPVFVLGNELYGTMHEGGPAYHGYVFRLRLQ